MNKLAVVVLNWNGAEMLEPCLNNLSKQSYENFRIVLVDNDSKDNSREILEDLCKKMGDQLHIIYHSKNSGFAGGVNIGINYALKHGFDTVALFNNDAVADEDWLKNLAQILGEKPKVGIATGLLLHADGKTIDSTGDWYSLWGLPFPRGRNKSAKSAPKSGYVFGASGGASLYRGDMLKEIGLFDETFFAYYEDVDISFRAQLAGWKVYYNNRAIAYHERGGSSKKVPKMPTYQTFKNLPLLFIKNVPTPFLGIIGPRFFLAYWLMFFNTVKKGTFGYALRGVLASLYYLPVSLYERWHIQTHKKATNSYINSIIWPRLPPQQSGLRKFVRKFNGKYDG